MRFESKEQVDAFISEFCKHVYERCARLKFLANNQTFQVHVKSKKKNYEGEPSKFLGCGRCIDFSKSFLVRNGPSIERDLLIKVENCFKTFKIEPEDLRGFGIHIKRNETPVLECGQKTLNFSAHQMLDLKRKSNHLTSPSKNSVISYSESGSPLKKVKLEPISSILKKSNSMKKKYELFENKYGINPYDVDLSIIPSLPEEIQKELKLLLDSIIKDNSNPVQLEIQPANRNQNDFNISKKKLSQVEDQTFSQLNLRDERNVYNGISYSRPTFRSETDPFIIKSWIRDWTNNLTKAPNAEDFKILERYLLDCITNLDLENCKIIIDFLLYRIKRTLKGKENAFWIEISCLLVEKIQTTVSDIYGAKLSFLYDL